MKIVGRRRWLQDVAVVAVVTVVTGADALWNQPGTRQADGWTLGLLGLSVAAVVVRRRWPVPVAAVCGLALTVWYGLGHRGELLYLPSAVALYTVAVTGGRRLTVFAGVVAVMWSAGLAWAIGDRSSAPVTEMLWPVVALLLGEVVRGRRELQTEHAAREARAAADREAEAARRVEQERLRIAREVHDVVAHTMAAVNVQMGVATAAFDERPEVARTALQQARTSSREALHELRTTVSLLREAAPGGPDEPAPDLGRLSELVAGVRRAGLQVSLDTNVDGHDVPSVAQLAAYRIVQEALTNVVRHSRAGSAVVSVMCDHDALVVEVRDDGVGDTRRPEEPSSRAAYGLIGMAERATALGGRVRFGRLPDGGFRVRAELPLGGTGP